MQLCLPIEDQSGRQNQRLPKNSQMDRQFQVWVRRWGQGAIGTIALL